MEINSDFRELLSVFNQDHVRYLVVGGYAFMKYAEPRYTKDLDLWIDPAPDNAERAFQALARFGAPLSGITAKDFTDPETVYQLGVDPIRIDILKAMAGLEFEGAWERRLESRLGDQPVHVLSREDLIATNLATGRKQDRADARLLQKKK